MEKILIVGKSSECDVVLMNKTVSRQHAQLVVQEMVVQIVDLDSTNGTYVNGQKITMPRKLYKGDKVMLGNEAFDWEAHIVTQPLLSDTADNTPEATAATTPVATTTGPSKKRVWTIAAVFVGIIGIALTLTFALPDGIMGGDETDPDSTKVAVDTIVEPGAPEYDFSCLEDADDGGTTGVITILSDIEGEMIDAYGEEITIEEELAFGKEVLAEMDCSDSGPMFTRISRIKKKLVEAIPEGSEYEYDIHLVKEDEINAFTCGGQIFVYTGIIDFCENDNELAAIIAHEIAHNELGHIKRKLSQIKTSNEIFGEGVGELTATMYMIATMAFGQKLETHCDLWGIDLSIKAGYSGCDVVNVWERMEDSEFNTAESMIRSHPFSSQRAHCCQNHLDAYHPNHCN